MKTQSSSSEARALRVGLVRGETLVAERIVPPGVAVTIGTGARNTLCIADPGAPRRHVLFAPRGGSYALRWTAAMSGRVAGAAAISDLGAGGGALLLEPGCRGKVDIGSWVVLFQQVPAPVAPARAAPHMKGLFVDEGDGEFMAFLGGFSSLAVMLVAAVIRTPLPTSEDVAAAPDRVIELIRVAPEAPLPRVIQKVVQVLTPHVAAHAPQTPEISHSAPPPRPRTRAELEADVMQQSPWLAVLTTHANSENGQSAPDLFDGYDADQARLTASLHGIQVAELNGGGAALHGPTSPEGRGDLTIGELGHSGGHSVTVGGGPGPSVHLPSQRDVEPVGGNPASNDAVRAQVVQYARTIQACYEQELRLKPSLEGRMVLDLHVQAGRVSSADVSENGTGDSGLETCAIGHAMRWHFDPSVTLDLSVPFSLSGT